MRTGPLVTPYRISRNPYTNRHAFTWQANIKLHHTVFADGRAFPAGTPLCVYKHQSLDVTLIQPYDGPAFWLSKQALFQRLVSLSYLPQQAAVLSGHKLKIPLLPVKNFVAIAPPPPRVVTSLATTTQEQQQINQNHIPINPMAAKKTKAEKEADKAAKAAAGTAPAAPVAAPVVPPLPVTGETAAPVVAAPPLPVAAGAPPLPTAAPVAAAAPTPAPAKPPRVKGEERNGLTRPTNPESTVGYVWGVCDRLTTTTVKDGQNVVVPAQRKLVIETCWAEKQTNPSTVTTQFGKWAKWNGFTGDNSPRKAAAAAAPAPVAAPAPAAATVTEHPAFTAGRDGYKRAALGEQVGNPYAAGSVENDEFNKGWAQGHQDLVAAQTAGAQ